MRIVVYDVLDQMKLEGGQPGWKRLVEFAQGSGVLANHKHSVPFDSAKVTVIGGLIGWGEDMRLDIHGLEVVSEGAEVDRMR